MGEDVVVGVGPVLIVERGRVGDWTRRVGVGGIGEGSVVEVERAQARGCPSGIGVRGR